MGGLLAVVTFLALTGCETSGDPTRHPNHQAARNDVVATVLVSDPTNASMDALGGGNLEVVGGCLGASGSVIVWPPGTKVVDDSPLRITIPGNGTFAIGDKVSVGGGYIHEPPTDPATEPVKVGSVKVPTACAAYAVFLAGPSTS